MAKIKYDTIPPDALVDIQVSGTFYRRLVELISMLGESVPLAEFKEVLEKLKENKPAKDLFELNVHLVISVIYEIEKQAKAQNKIKEEEMEVPDEPTDSSSKDSSPAVV